MCIGYEASGSTVPLSDGKDSSVSFLELENGEQAEVA